MCCCPSNNGCARLIPLSLPVSTSTFNWCSCSQNSFTLLSVTIARPVGILCWKNCLVTRQARQILIVCSCVGTTGYQCWLLLLLSILFRHHGAFFFTQWTARPLQSKLLTDWLCGPLGRGLTPYYCSGFGTVPGVQLATPGRPSASHPNFQEQDRSSSQQALPSFVAEANRHSKCRSCVCSGCIFFLDYGLNLFV